VQAVLQRESREIVLTAALGLGEEHEGRDPEQSHGAAVEFVDYQVRLRDDVEAGRESVIPAEQNQRDQLDRGCGTVKGSVQPGGRHDRQLSQPEQLDQVESVHAVREMLDRLDLVPDLAIKDRGARIRMGVCEQADVANWVLTEVMPVGPAD